MTGITGWGGMEVEEDRDIQDFPANIRGRKNSTSKGRDLVSCERRNRVQHVSAGILILISVSVFAVIAFANEKGAKSLDEHSGVVMDLLVWAFLIVASALVGLVLWNVKDLKNSIRLNHEELRREIKKKMSIQLHNAICDHQVAEED